MNTRLLTLIATLLVFSGCVSNNQVVKPTHPYISPYSNSVNDVDMSDLDENLSESEMMITEDGQMAKLKRMPFPVSEYYALPLRGKGTIKGSIYLTDRYGSQVLGNATRLYLNPVTSYSTEWYNKSYISGHKMEKADSRLFNHLKFTSSNSYGEFAFYGVPNGNYYLIGTVKCGQRCGFESEKNIRLTTKVSVHGNQIIQQNLTRNLR